MKGGMGRRRECRGRERVKKGERIGKGEKGLELDNCPGPPEFLVTPLLSTNIYCMISRYGRITCMSFEIARCNCHANKDNAQVKTIVIQLKTPILTTKR